MVLKSAHPTLHFYGEVLGVLAEEVLFSQSFGIADDAHLDPQSLYFALVSLTLF